MNGMKRTLSVLLLLALLLALAVPAGAAEADGFEIDENGVLTKYTGPGGEVTIPAGATAIGDGAFLSCQALTGVTIPGSVERIGATAFAGCENLTRAAIGQGVTEIGVRAFVYCTALTEVVIPSSVKTVDGSAFDGCVSLASVTISEGVEKIGTQAFYGCRSLTSVTIPGTVTKIGSGAFYDCKALKSVTILGAGMSIGAGAFTGTPWLASLGDFAIVGGVLLAYQGKAAEVTVPAGVTSVGSCAFSNCSNLTAVVLPEGLTSIGDSAFESCTGLRSVTFPESLTSIGGTAFYNCLALQEVRFPTGLTSIGGGAFNGCGGLTSVTIAAKEISVVGGAFSNCGSLTSVTISANAAAIGDNAFSGCGSLTDLTVTQGVLTVGRKAFSGCGALTRVTVRARVDAAAVNAFEGTPWLASGDLYILGDLLVAYQGSGGNVTIPTGVRRIEKEAFSGCTGLTGVNIPEGVKEIGEKAFYECTGLASLTLPTGMETIETGAFSGCTGLTGVAIPGSVKEIGEKAFSDCTGLTAVTIPEGVESIGLSAFSRCTSLTEVTIPASVETIGDYAFYGCSGLKRFRALGSPRKLGTGLFGKCSALEEALFPAAVRAAVPMESNNLLQGNDRSAYRETDNSCLYWDGEGYVRVENVSGILTVERYSPDFQLLSARSIEYDLTSLWGGFFIGETYNFIVTGKAAWEGSGGRSMLSVTKYSKEWDKLGQGFVYVPNDLPFESGSLYCTEADGELYVHTCHQDNRCSDGKLRQVITNITFRQSDVKYTDSGYLNTSGRETKARLYNQFILADGEEALLEMDMGDAAPRALMLRRFEKEPGSEKFTGQAESLQLMSLPGTSGDSVNGVAAGGLGETEKAVLAVWNFNGTGGQEKDYPVRNVIFSWTDKADFSEAGTRTVQVTDYPEEGDQGAGIPVLVPTGLDGGYILWEVVQVDWSNDRVDTESPQNIAWVRYSADGSVGEIHTAPGALSDCKPIVVDGKVVWYAAGKDVPTFYTLDTSGLKAQTAAWQAPEAIKVKTNGELVWWTDAEPFIDANSRTMVPLRAVAEALGLTVSWDGQAREAVFTDGAKTLSFPIGSTEARTGDGGVVVMDTAAVIVSSRTYAPIRYLAEYFGYKVDWDGGTKTVILTKLA